MQNNSLDFTWSNATKTNITSSEIDLDYLPNPEYEIFLDTVRFWIQKVLIPITVIIGVLGNTVTIVVLTRRRMRSSTHLYLTALATSDFFYLIFNFTLSLIHYDSVKSYYTYFEYYGYGHMLTDACSNTSVWLTVSFTLERYIAVCHPIRGKVLCTESRAKFVVIGVFLFCFISTLPTPFEYAMGTRRDSNTNQTLYAIGYSSLGDDATYQKVYYWFTTIFFILIPLTLIAVFNSFLIRAVHHSKQERRRMTSVRGERQEQYSSQETKITIMLIAVVVLFLLCQVPTSIMLIYGTMSEYGSEKEHTIVVSLNNICNLLMAINASCNFVLYCAFSDRYRKTFLLTFLPCWYHPPSPIHSQSVCYKTTVTEGGMLSRSPSCRSRSPSQRSFRRAGSSRHGSTRSRGRGSFRNNSTRDSSVRTTKQNYLTVPNGDPPNVSVPHQSPESPVTPESSGSGNGVSMCFQLPKGPLRILGSNKKEEEGKQCKTQSVPLQWTTTEHIDFPREQKDTLTCL
uniref:G-protein coupled receptors family 1 profile domain-containing protein n=1 Tax=Strigamia maritima TaxID=126957 RepID=T1JCS4_STRMM